MAQDINTPAKGLTLDQAFTQLKASRGKSQATPDQLEDENVDVVDEDLDGEDFNADALVDDSEDSEGDDLDEDSEDSEGGDAEEEAEVWEIEVDGETVEVTTEELHKGYLRNNDYTRKRQADAQKAKALETEYTTKLTQLNTALQQNVSQDQQTLHQLQQKYKSAPDDATKRNLHYQMLQLQHNIGTRQQALQQAKALQEQTAQASAEAYWHEQEEILRGQYDDWDSKKNELAGYLQSQGFEDLSMFGHAKMASLVEKAKQFDELQQKRNIVAKKKIRRKVPAVLKAGQGEKVFRADKKVVQVLESRFAKTNSIKDAQALLRARRGK
jgi:hypothetical protein